MPAFDVRPGELRDDWADDPTLSDYDVHALTRLGDGEIEYALTEACRRHEQRLAELYDEIRGDATRMLLDRTTR